MQIGKTMTLFNDTAEKTAAAKLDFASITGQCQYEFDREFYNQILTHNANNVDVLRQQVELLANCGDYKAALRLDERLIHLAPHDVIARYNLACSLSMVGRVDEALTALDDALELGYCDWAHLEADSDLAPVRDHLGFDRLLRKYGLA